MDKELDFPKNILQELEKNSERIVSECPPADYEAMQRDADKDSFY